jgi:Flp pilus assembly protein TadG
MVCLRVVRLPRRLRDRRGVAAVEFALLAPILITLLASVVDLGLAIERSIRLETSAQAGAQYILRFPNDTDGAATAAEAAAGSGATATATPLPCQCPAADGTNGAEVACNGTCATGMARYVRVSVTRSYTPIFPTSFLIPFGALGATNASVVVRIL